MEKQRYETEKEHISKVIDDSKHGLECGGNNFSLLVTVWGQAIMGTAHCSCLRDTFNAVSNHFQTKNQLINKNDMSKYDRLWQYIGSCGKKTITVTFEEIADITGASIDHSFLQYKKELPAYGYEVSRISMKEQKVTFQKC